MMLKLSMQISLILLLFVIITRSFNHPNINKINQLPFRKSFLALAKQSSASDKIRVKLLQDIEQGKKNEIIMISKALFSNVLEPKKLAIKISDQQFEEINKQKQEEIIKEIENAAALANILSETQNLEISKKVGAKGQLFGSVNGKAFAEHLRELHPSYAENVLSSKHFSIIDIKENANDNKIKIESLTEIRNAGSYKVTIRLHPKVNDITLNLNIVPQK